MFEAATAVWGDRAMASTSALSCPPPTMAGMAHGEDLMGGMLLDTDAARGRPGTMSGLFESMLGPLKPEEKRCNFFRGSHWSAVLPFGHLSRMEANPGHAARTWSCSQAHTNLFSQHEPFSLKTQHL